MCLPALPSAYAASSPKRLLGQLEIDEQFSKALDLVGNGHFVFGAENKYLLALRDVLKEAVNDQYDYIDWWLYEATDDYTVWEADCTMKYCLKEPETKSQGLFNHFYKEVTFCGLHHESYA